MTDVSNLSDAIGLRLKDCSQSLVAELRCDLQQQIGKGDKSNSDLANSDAIGDKSNGELANSDAIETRLREQLMRDLESQEVRINASMQQLAQSELTKSLVSVAQRVSGDVRASDLPTAIEEKLRDSSKSLVEEVRRELQETIVACQTKTGESPEKSQVQDHSTDVVRDLRRDLEAQESRIIASLQRIARQELLSGFKDVAQKVGGDDLREAIQTQLRSYSQHLAEEIRRDFEQQGLEVQSLKAALSAVQTSVSEAEKHVAGCEAAAEACSRSIDNIDAQESQLRKLAEELHARILREGHALLGQIGVMSRHIKGASSDAEAEDGTERCPEGDFIADLERRVNELESVVSRLQQLLVAMRDQMVGGDDEADDSPSPRSSCESRTGPMEDAASESEV